MTDDVTRVLDMVDESLDFVGVIMVWGMLLVTVRVCTPVFRLFWED